MSAGENLITSWIENKLPWKWVYSPATTVLTIPANGEIQYSKHTHPEGVLTHAISAFDSPLCGIRIRTEPSLDTQRTQIINTAVLGGGYSPNIVGWASMPPTTLPGNYVMQLVRAVPWMNFIEFHMFNNDTVPHRFLIGGYTMAVLLKERPESDTRKLIRLMEENLKKGGSS